MLNEEGFVVDFGLFAHQLLDSGVLLLNKFFEGFRGAHIHDDFFYIGGCFLLKLHYLFP